MKKNIFLSPADSSSGRQNDTGTQEVSSKFVSSMQSSENHSAEPDTSSLINGPILKNLVKFAVPVIFSMLASQLYSLVDSMVIGHFLNANALAAVSNSSTVLMVFLFISGGMELGCGLLIAAKQSVFSKKEMSRLLYNLLFLDLVIGFFMTVAGLISFRFWLRLIQSPDEIINAAWTYGKIYLFFLPLQMFYDVSREMMIGMGDSKSPMRMVVATSIMNILLDLCMVPVWGVAGAAVATGISQLTGFLWILMALRRNYLIGGFHFCLLSFEFSTDILRLAPPNMLQQASGMVITMIQQSLLGGFGAMAIAGVSCYSKTNTFLLMPLFGFTQALVIFIAQNTSVGKEERIREAIRETRIIFTIYSGFITIICFFFAHLLIGLYTSNPEASAYGVLLMTREPASKILYALRLNQEAQMRGRQQMGRYLISSVGSMAFSILCCIVLINFTGFHAFYICSYISNSIMLLVSIMLVRR